MVTETENSESTLGPEQLQSGKAAFEMLLPRYRAVLAHMLLPVRVDVLRAALFALGVAQKVNEPQRRVLFAKLPSDLFDITLLDLLEPAARGAMYARAEVATAEALASEAKLPAATVQEALQVRERMLRVAGYHLSDDEEISKLIANIRAGTGYTDLAEDLWRLSQLYRDHAALLSRDPSHYNAADPDTAERIAKTIQDELGIGGVPKRNDQRDILERAWTVLLTTYESIAKPGRWLLADDGGEQLFISLHAAGRRPQKPRKEK
ncbi:MAG TPA: hypothetical protein DFS52_15260 [Myxococcales bacterium]|nr:hypothetical protein [Myxococcales bacterium]